MNKKTLLIVVSIITLSVLSVGVFIDRLKIQTVAFERQTGVSDIYLYLQSDSKEPYRTISSQQNTTKLKAGTYYYVAVGDNLDLKREQFTVAEDAITVQVNPEYTEAYLSQMLQNETAAISSAIIKKYAFAATEYEVVSGRLFQKGEWFGAIIKKRVDPRDITDLYRIILKKSDGEWTVVNRPEIIATTKLFPDVPIDILRAINSF